MLALRHGCITLNPMTRTIVRTSRTTLIAVRLEHSLLAQVDALAAGRQAGTRSRRQATSRGSVIHLLLRAGLKALAAPELATPRPEAKVDDSTTLRRLGEQAGKAPQELAALPTRSTLPGRIPGPAPAPAARFTVKRRQREINEATQRRRWSSWEACGPTESLAAALKREDELRPEKERRTGWLEVAIFAGSKKYNQRCRSCGSHRHAAIHLFSEYDPAPRGHRFVPPWDPAEVADPAAQK